ncbi:MAG: tetraacyldisaccharide 4'-kinase, partial [Omnitrophica bacterium GWA2_52_8]
MSSKLRNFIRLTAEDRDHSWTAAACKPFLEVASWGYGLGAKMLRTLHERGVLTRKRLPFPVISIGNLTWGGTGKTPFVEYLARRIIDRKSTPMILMRGYGQDEVAQMKRQVPKAVLGIGVDRFAVAQKIAKQEPVNLALLDDGFQHWALERDLEIVLVNALNPFGNGKLIPRGILREPVHHLKK